MFDFLSDNMIIICPSSIKTKIIKEESKDYQIKFLDKRELIDNFHFSYSFKTIVYLNEKYGYSYSNSKEILDCIRKINVFSQETNMLDKLNKIYLDLINNDLIEFNPYFKYLFNDKKIKVIGYSKNDIELQYMLKMIGCDYEFIKEEGSFRATLYEAKNISEEVLILFNKIGELIEKGVSLNNIYLYEYPSCYDSLIRKYARYMNIALEDEACLVSDTNLFKVFFNSISDKDDINEIIDKYEGLNDGIIKDKIASIISEVGSCKFESNRSIIDAIKYLAKNTFVRGKAYQEEISIINYNCVLGDDDYLFILGFNHGDFPKYSKDIDIITNDEKRKAKINDAFSDSQIEEELIINLIKNTKNTFISYKLKDGKEKFIPSEIIKKLGLGVSNYESSVRYNMPLAKQEVAKLMDLDTKYKVKSEYLNTFSKEELEYNSYDHKFKGIDNYYDDKGVILSYTQINEYKKCPFSYFVKRILKANIFEDTFFTKLGTLFHKILETSVSKEINLSDYDKEISETFNDAKEKHFIYKLLPQVMEVINKNKEFINNSHITKVVAEKDVTIKVDDKTKIEGKLDKVLIDEVGKNIAIVDYKTGDFSFDMKKVEYGLDMQLALYAFILGEIYPDYDIAGLYIQNVCLSNNKKDDKAYKLCGISSNDFGVIRSLDKNFERKGTSDYINNLKLKIDGTWNSNSRVYDKLTFNHLREKALEEIKLASENIRSGKFDIRPVAYNNEELPCKYCPCKAICLKDNNDIKVISTKEDK